MHFKEIHFLHKLHYQFKNVMSKIYLNKSLNIDMTKLHYKKKCNVQNLLNKTLIICTYRYDKTALQKNVMSKIYLTKP